MIESKSKMKNKTQLRTHKHTSVYKYKNYLKGFFRRIDGAEFPVVNPDHERLKHTSLNSRIISHIKIPGN